MPVTPRVIRVKPLRQTDFRWRFPPDRTLHVVDIENLAGVAVPTRDRVSQVQVQYLARLRFGADDHVVLATNHLALLNAGLGWPRARHLVRSGKDGADLELIDVLEHENVAARFSHVVIGSGDGGFTRAAASLAARGIQVTVVSRWGSLSYELSKVASDVIYLDDPLTAAA
ncbi:MAG: NYN domain-containing protein [Trebonia sp.]